MGADVGRGLCSNAQSAEKVSNWSNVSIWVEVLREGGREGEGAIIYISECL